MDHFRLIDEMIKAVENSRKTINKNKADRVRSVEEKDLLVTVSTLWFKKIRPGVLGYVDEYDLQDVDLHLRNVFDATAKAARRTVYKTNLSGAIKSLKTLRGLMPASIDAVASKSVGDTPLDFSSLVSEAKMQQLMTKRWNECVICIDSGASLASVVMMGGLLESLFISRANHLDDLSVLLKAKRAPQYKGKPKQLREWTLNSYIEVGHELGWIGDTAKSVSNALRDYRNYIHPQTEYSSGKTIEQQDAVLLWGISKILMQELLRLP